MKILVVEDDRTTADALRRGLEAEGYAVEVAHDGVDGLWLANEAAPDVIVLDIMLPGKNGFQVCAELREAGNWTPILMLTAKDGDLDQTAGLDTGADDYLVKPFSFPLLLARIRALLRRVWRGDREVDLTARQFDVLEYLVRRAGQVVAKQEILNGVWRFDFDGDPNIVEVYIRRLRRAIDEPFDRHSIETVRGVGYRLVADGDADR